MPEHVREPLASYACALRTHDLDDDEVADRIEELGAPREWADQLIADMDASGWKANSNSRPTAIGWLSIIVAVGVTGAGSYFLSGVLSIPLGIGRVIFILPFVALGFVAHIGVSKFMESLGIRMSVSEPLPIPNEHVLRSILDEHNRR